MTEGDYSSEKRRYCNNRQKIVTVKSNIQKTKILKIKTMTEEMKIQWKGEKIKLEKLARM